MESDNPINVYIKSLNYILDNGDNSFSKKILWELSKDKKIVIEKNPDNSKIEYALSREEYKKSKNSKRITRVTDLKHHFANKTFQNKRCLNFLFVRWKNLY